MSIVSKTNPKGVDNVIDAIQQYLYPSLLGLGWTDYEMYPRANKNADGQSIIPEISTDPKDYQEVLFSDKYNATSFFLVSDEVQINNEERLIVQDVSIIFQLNLKELYPTVTTHRADEEAHAHLTQLFTSNDELFVDTTGYVTTVQRVYSDLSIQNFSRGNLNLDDMSRFHVVRYDFTVTYGLDDCQLNYSPTCDPASISINGDAFQIVPSGGALDITIVDTLGADPVQSIVGNIVTVAPTGGITGISYLRLSALMNVPTATLTHGIQWYLDNTNYFDELGTGAMPIVDQTNPTTLLTNNAFGNTNRITNDLGAQIWDGSDGSTADYAIDHLTGMGIYLQNAVNTSTSWITSAANVNGASYAGYSNWRMFTFMDLRLIEKGEGNDETVLDGIQSWSFDATFCMDCFSTTQGSFARFNRRYESSQKWNAFTATSSSSGIGTIAIRNHY